MGLIKIILSVVGILVLAVVGIAAYMYFTDYEAEGTITQKGKDSQGDFVIIVPKLYPTEIKQHIDSNAAAVVCKDYTVQYRIQSGHYRVLDAQGRLVYDSVDGLATSFSPVRCAALGV